jgi:hypothetical protein
MRALMTDQQTLADFAHVSVSSLTRASINDSRGTPSHATRKPVSIKSSTR